MTRHEAEQAAIKQEEGKEEGLGILSHPESPVLGTTNPNELTPSPMDGAMTPVPPPLPDLPDVVG